MDGEQPIGAVANGLLCGRCSQVSGCSGESGAQVNRTEVVGFCDLCPCTGHVEQVPAGCLLMERFWLD